MMQIYLSEDLCKKLYIKFILRSYKFPKKKIMKTCRPAVGKRLPETLLARAL